MKSFQHLITTGLLLTMTSPLWTLTINNPAEANDIVDEKSKTIKEDSLLTKSLIPVDRTGDIIGRMPPRSKSGLTDPNSRWPANTVVYEFDPTFPSDFRATFLRAINHITGRTCVLFKERSTEPDYILVDHGSPCNSPIGKLGGGMQSLSLGKDCSEFGTHVRELVHAIGFGNEENRSDRDKYVTINLLNVDQADHYKFDEYDPTIYDLFSVPYDYESLMHHGPKYLSSNDKDTITPKQIGVNIGQNRGLSKLDIRKINNMYCAGTLGMSIRSVSDGRYLDVRGGLAGEGNEVISTKMTGEDSQKWTADWIKLMDETVGSTIANWAQDGGLLKVMNEDRSTSIVKTWGYATGNLNQLWSVVEVPVTGSIQQRFQIKNFGTGHCLSSPSTRCFGLNLFEFIFKKFIHAACKGGQVKTVKCNNGDSKQLWNIDFV